jgi:hypothetical protein
MISRAVEAEVLRLQHAVAKTRRYESALKNSPA